MKREGRQHGMVRTYMILPSPWNPRSKSRSVRQIDSTSTAGLSTKVLIKPTNHSKFTGRCGKPRCLGCHMHPVCKSKNKTKGTHKLRSSDVVTNPRLITWRVVDGRPGLKYSGLSASRVLDHLSYEGDYEDVDDDYMHNDHYHDGDSYDDECGVVNDGFNMKPHHEMRNYEGDEIEEKNGTISDEDKSIGVYVVEDDDDDDVRYVSDQDLEDEDWCYVSDQGLEDEDWCLC